MFRPFVWCRRKSAVVKAFLWQQYSDLADWLGPDIRAVAGYINIAELLKAVKLGTAGGASLGAAQAVADAAHLIFVEPSAATSFSLIFGVGVFAVDVLRRIRHGRAAAVVPLATAAAMATAMQQAVDAAPAVRDGSAVPIPVPVMIPVVGAPTEPGDDDEDDFGGVLVFVGPPASIDPVFEKIAVRAAQIAAPDAPHSQKFPAFLIAILVEVVASLAVNAVEKCLEKKLDRVAARPHGLLAWKLRHTISWHLPSTLGDERPALADGLLQAAVEARNDPETWQLVRNARSAANAK